jgi:hypothetical protein
MVHYAKVDWWVAPVFGGAALCVVAVATTLLVVGLSAGDHAPAAVLAISSMPLGIGVLFGLMLWGCYNIRYVVTPSDLIVRFGPFRITLPLDMIVEVVPTNDPTSAPAPSLDRLQIKSRRKNGELGYTLISPKDKEGFVCDLANAAPHLRRVGDGSMRLKAEMPT